ncbi:phytoene desaturase [Metallosphaera tengchongensis]|uniref:Phytoene desaturase n=1 Tax=Metallosphaera tengchongensis TaxID=1532350 RepID=A0A6N0NV35_9CREN|nr:phytoene desaturase family protein [Metallosphaera tengchongensis]QKR00666.1 phytoene desaturase [Metallosphaera tengchongensis]
MRAVVVGAGIGGLSTALLLQKKGLEVTVLEKLDVPGGRARGFSDAVYSFDMGPSWYLMPEVFQRFYRELGEGTPEVKEVDPLFSLYVGDMGKEGTSRTFWKDEYPVRGDLEGYLQDTEFMYKMAMERFLFKEMRVYDFLDPTIIKNLGRFPLFTSLDSFNRRYFSEDFSLKSLGFSSVFLGGSPFNTPAIYAMVNYAILGGGVYYPKGGFQGLVNRLYDLCKRAGVEFRFNEEVNKVEVRDKVVAVWGRERVEGDVFVFNMDYERADSMLPYDYSLGESYWKKKKLSPSAVLGYLGVEGEVKVPHHSIFVNGDWRYHFDSITKGNEPDLENLSYYVSYRKASDDSLRGQDLVFLIPVSAGLESLNLKKYIDAVVSDFKAKTGSKFTIKYERMYGPSDFKRDYNAFKGTAFGISHTLDQTGPFRLPMRHRKLDNLFFVGQYTQPGIGVPMVTISSMLVSEKVLGSLRK